MRQLIFMLFAALLLLPLFGSACSYAYQYSLYPMGMSAGKLVVLEVDLERYVNHPDFKMGMGGHQVFSADVESRWKGNLRLCYWLDGNLETIGMVARNVDFDDKKYAESLAPHFQNAYNTAAELPFFESALLDRVGTCHFDITCPFFQKKVIAEEALAYNYLNENPDILYSLDVPLPILEKFEQMTNDSFTDLSKIEPQIRTDFYKIWKPYNVRIYTIGTQSFIAFTMGWGQKLPTPTPTDKEWDKMPPPAEQFIEGQEVLLHGYRFDFIHLLQQP